MGESGDKNLTFAASPPAVVAEDQVVDLGEGSLFAKWYVDDPEASAFHRVVRRLLLRITSVGAVKVDRDRRRPFRPHVRRDKKDRGRYWRYGHDAERWALARRHNYFRDDGFWKPDTYPYAEDDFIRVEEMTPRERKHREEILESIRRDEAYEAARRARRAKPAAREPAGKNPAPRRREP